MVIIKFKPTPGPLKGGIGIKCLDNILFYREAMIAGGVLTIISLKINNLITLTIT